MSAAGYPQPAAQSPNAAPQPVPGSPEDPLTDAIRITRGAVEARVGLKLLGGLGVRVVCPDYPPRLRRDQDIDFACLSKERKAAAAYLEQAGCQPDRRFNNLNGDRQMYFTAPSGRPIDVMVDRLTMCHGAGLAIDADRFAAVLGADWGWWRTVTGNLDRLPALLAERPQLAQPGMPFDPVEQSVRLRQLAETAPKSMKWKMRAGLGDKVRWYELPEEVGH